MSRNNDPLVSIIVITYNSSKYVLETLESAKAQTYQNIELIVSDDASQDDTVEICKAWLEENTERFVRTEMVTIDQNSGIPANCNRGLKAAAGDWMKLIAGDDILKKECISEFVEFSNDNPTAKFIASNMDVLQGDEIVGMTKLDPYILNGSAQHQLKMFCRFHFIVPGPSLFYHKDTFLTLGGYDERFKLVEDYPMVFNVLRKNYKFHHLSKELVTYREHLNSVTRSQNNIRSIYEHFINLELLPFLKKKHPLLSRHYKLKKDLEFNKHSQIVKFIISLYIRLTDHYYWYFIIQKKIFKRRGIPML